MGAVQVSPLKGDQNSAQGETLGFYEAAFVKARCEKSFILVSG
jgi:hypothetical protein